MIETLRDELLLNHEVTGQYSADDAIAASELNAVNLTRLIPIGSAELLAWSAASSTGDRPRVLKIEEAALSHVSEAVQASAKTAERMIARDNTVLDLNLPDRMALVDGLVLGGVLSSNDKRSLVSLATESVSRATKLGLGKIRVGNIQEAR